MNRTIAIFAFAVAVAGTAVPAGASTFTISGSGSSFTIQRSGEGTNAAETVLYRTAGLSAFPGQHYTEKSGTLVFAPGQTTTNIAVSARSPSADAYKYQTGGTTRSYRFELMDEGGFGITNVDRSVSSGTSVPSSGMFDVKSVTIQSSEYTADDDGYDKNGYKAAASSGYFDNAAPRAWFQQIGAELRMTLSMDAKENDDAYEYLQLLFNNVSTCDNRSDADNGDPGAPNLSKYMAGFEMNTGSKDSTYRNYTFPVTNVGNNASASNPWGYSSDGKYPLSKQKFKSGSCAADGRIVVPLDFTNIVLRLNASGKSGSDEWAAKNVKANIQAVDSTKPVPVSTSAISVGPGPYCKGNSFYISVPFSEIVYSSGFKTIYTTWGFADYHSGDGSNVITFRGMINAEVGATLAITNCACNFRDIANNFYQSSSSGLNKTFTGTTVAASYAYLISYDLGGGTLPENAPTNYIYDAETTLLRPTRMGYDFVGWTGSNGSTPMRNVDISVWSHGPRSYTANWTPHTYTVRFNANGGTETMDDQSFTYDVAQDLTANAFTRTGYDFAGWAASDDGSGATYADGQGVSNLTPDDNDVFTLYAQWTPHTYTVRFNANGGTETMDDQSFTYDVAQNLATNTFTAPFGYQIYRWTTNVDGTGDSYTDGQSVTNLTSVDGATITLYAQ